MGNKVYAYSISKGRFLKVQTIQGWPKSFSTGCDV